MTSMMMEPPKKKLGESEQEKRKKQEADQQEAEFEQSRSSSNVADELIRHILSERSLVGAITIDSRVINVADVSRDVLLASVQFEMLEEKMWEAYLARFQLRSDYSLETTSFDVPIQIPELDAAGPSYEIAIEQASKAGLELLNVPPAEGWKVFLDRAKEFLNVRISSLKTHPPSLGSPSPNIPTHPTTVDSSRAGDVVLYTKGYFLSTRTVFGRSTPASNMLPAGRYGFGVEDGKQLYFSNFLVDVPYPGNIWLPLP